MGLFSSVLHLRDADRESALAVIDTVVRDAAFSHVDTLTVPNDGPYALPYSDLLCEEICYLVSPLHGRWLTIIEAHFAVPGAPHLEELGNRLSAELSCYSLALFVHDDDLFFYNLSRDGAALDGYNSCPQYFEQNRLSDAQIEEQRHSPEPFQPLLPTDCSTEELRKLLNRGWWNAYDAGELDENGVAQHDDDGFLFEHERMTAFGTLLQLHGNYGEYPFAAWGGGTTVQWDEFVAVRYRSANSSADSTT
jgi:hypothetical protein